ncbi:MAG: cytochrome c oxidase subunit II [Candidatus Marinimicrobia bacterium]|nr:cytochrome c oxidase subunit II [Candidatus Neomarinimicrobiota bacterium]MDD9888256.1 cytochrome c oxidase subunit II [Candidatus Neomarinimicrobiota bacterium]MDD9931244.1 cytochrome c oxidase subunit II [Candidatus Neomarinimicrobiota bacterium]
MLELLRNLGLPSVAASTQGPAIDNIISIVHWLMLILFVGWGAYFIYALIKFKASSNPKADYHGVKSHFSSYIEAGVAVIEVVLLFGFAFPIWASRVNDVPKGPDSVQIRVVAQQFAWNIHYPGDDGVFGKTSADLVDEVENPIGLDRSDEFAKDDIFTINQLHIPVNTPINIALSSKDVIHSFGLTELRVKQDAIPGMEIPVWFEATMTTEEFLKTTVGTAREGKGFEISCAQLCGLGHYRMKGFLTIHDDEGYANWLEEQKQYIVEDDEDDWGDDEDW